MVISKIKEACFRIYPSHQKPFPFDAASRHGWLLSETEMEGKSG